MKKLNRQYNRTGTLWQGQYKASLIQDDRYLLTCYRYIELIPVRAGIAQRLGDYPYSSYDHNATGQTDALLTTYPICHSLTATQEQRLSTYRALFADEITPELLALVRDTANACLVLGNDRFKDQIEAMVGRSVRPAKSGRPAKHSP